MRYGALVPALTVAAALGAPLVAEADHHRDRDRRSRYDRPSRGHGGTDRSGRRGHKYRRRDTRASHRGYTHGYHYGRHHRLYYRYPRHHYRPYPPRVYYRPYSTYRPVPPVHHPPYPVPYGYPFAPPPYRRGVHGGISIGVPGFGLSLVF
jgi:Ni/Co efflux regulator RcnB